MTQYGLLTYSEDEKKEADKLCRELIDSYRNRVPWKIAYLVVKTLYETFPVDKLELGPLEAPKEGV